ncbi:hypothetical protein FACS1894195_1690 [Bacteroidia bacterium]|nr:hypothetical protein FACS1894195_1690 [Bacteroidia bacterium]
MRILYCPTGNDGTSSNNSPGLLKTGKGDLKNAALLTGKGVYTQCWLNAENGFWFSSPEAYSFNEMPKARALMYKRPRGIWELMMETLTTEANRKKYRY